jgi:hypothetical protein
LIGKKLHQKNRHVFRTMLVASPFVRTFVVWTKVVRAKVVLTKVVWTNVVWTKVARTKVVRTNLVQTKVVQTNLVRTKVVRTKVVRTKLKHFQSISLFPLRGVRPFLASRCTSTFALFQCDQIRRIFDVWAHFSVFGSITKTIGQNLP